jgi:hypothetical protein
MLNRDVPVFKVTVYASEDLNSVCSPHVLTGSGAHPSSYTVQYSSPVSSLPVVIMQ